MAKTPKIRIPETEYAAILVEHLIADGWEVYQEVPVTYSDRADIVAIKRDPKIAWIIEVKTSMSGRLYWQARRWTNHRADYVSVAVPKPRLNNPVAREAVKSDYDKNGIGIIYIDHATREISELSKPVKQEIPGHQIGRHDDLFSLSEEFKTFCPAGSQGGHLTPYKVTCLNLVAYAKEHPGCTLKDAIKNTDHHYASDQGAIGTISKWGIRGAKLVLCIFPDQPEIPQGIKPEVDGDSFNSIEKENPNASEL